MFLCSHVVGKATHLQLQFWLDDYSKDHKQPRKNTLFSHIVVKKDKNAKLFLGELRLISFIQHFNFSIEFLWRIWDTVN